MAVNKVRQTMCIINSALKISRFVLDQSLLATFVQPAMVGTLAARGGGNRAHL